MNSKGKKYKIFLPSLEAGKPTEPTISESEFAVEIRKILLN
jgi:hypothetical protein